MKLIGKELYSTLTGEASKSDRKRTHYSLHPDLDDKIHRLCLAIDRGSYIRPHRHPELWKWEFFVILQGSAIILTFDEKGQVTEKVSLSNNGPLYAVEIPSNTWHTMAAQENGTLLLEVKPGPFSPPFEHDFAQWAPREGDVKAKMFEAFYHKAETGSMITDFEG